MLTILGNKIDSERQFTNGLYAHGELEKMCGYDLVTVTEWGAFMDNVAEGIYDVDFICPNNVIVEAKAFVWCADVINNRRVMKGLVVKVDDYKHILDAQKKYDSKAEFI